MRNGPASWAKQSSLVDACAAAPTASPTGVAPLPLTSPVMVGDVDDHRVHAQDRWLIATRWVRPAFGGDPVTLAVPTR